VVVTLSLYVSFKLLVLIFVRLVYKSMSFCRLFFFNLITLVSLTVLLLEDFLIKGVDRTSITGWTWALCTHFYTKINGLSLVVQHYRMV
jgi:hypothetical protein